MKYCLLQEKLKNGTSGWRPLGLKKNFQIRKNGQNWLQNIEKQPKNFRFMIKVWRKTADIILVSV